MPLTKESDFTLVKRVKEDNCNDSLKELVERHAALCYNVCYRYSSMLISRGVHFDDVLKDRDYIVYKSILSFNETKNTKFSTWLGNFTRYYCLNLINKKNHLCLEDKELHCRIDKKALEEVNPAELKELRDYVLNILSQLKDARIRKVFELRYFSNKGKITWNKISNEMEISIQTAINLHERGRVILKRKIKSKRYGDLV